MGDGVGELFLVVRDRAASSTKRERRPNNERKAELIAEAQRILRVIDERRRRNFEANLPASVLEPTAVFGNFDGAKRRADHFHLMLLEYATFGSSTARLRAVCPPTVGRSASGFSLM